jgi:chaperonin GroES
MAVDGNRNKENKEKTKMKIRPLGDRVLVEPIEEKEQTVGGIIIPDSAKEKPMQGKVLAVGRKTDKDGKELKFDVKAGDTVLLPKYGGTEVKLDGKKLQLVREEDLLGVIEK